MKTRLLLLALALLLALSACGKEPPEPAATPAPTPTAAPQPGDPTPPASAAPGVPLADPAWGDQVFTKEYAAGDGTVVLTVAYKLPMVQNTDAFPAGEAINRWYQTEGAARMEEAEESYELAVSDYDVCTAAGLSFQATNQEMNYQITWQDEALISVRREWYINSGGPYPNIFRLSEQFDAAAGAKLGFADLFSDPEQVMAKVLDAFMAAWAGEPPTREAVSAALQPENFYLTEEGVTFWIQGGSMPGVLSPAEVTLPYEALEGLWRHG